MANSNPTLPPEIGKVLGQMRWRIRRYVWLEGLAVACVWLGATFWIGLGFDYLPVILGANEMPVGARIVLLATISMVLAFILYRWILRRTFVHLRGQSLAILIERQFPQFQDSLVTTVEMDDKSTVDPEIDPMMVQQTKTLASQLSQEVKLSKVFDYQPLIRSMALAFFAVASIVLFGFVSQDALATWASRMYLLSDEPWPRKTKIEIVGFGEDRILKVAEGDDVSIRVKAHKNFFIPNICTIVYQTEKGETGRVNMSKDGEVRGDFQYYLFTKTPFKGMLETVTFDVVGYDHRIRDFQIQVVPSPAIVDITLEYQEPKYTDRASREETWLLGKSLLMGSDVTISARVNKPLNKVELIDINDANSTFIRPSDDGLSFTFEIQNLDGRVGKLIELHDQDGLKSQQPFRFVLGAIEDVSPAVTALLKGIGDAITPMAILPLEIGLDDDFGVEKAWIDLADRELNQVQTFPIPLPKQPGNIKKQKKFELLGSLDLRLERNENEFELDPGQNVVMTVRARDYFDLTNKRNIGISEEYPLRVVEPSELMALLEARELELRRRFEQTIVEIKQTRDSLVRVKPDPNAEKSSEAKKTEDETDNDSEQTKEGSNSADSEDSEESNEDRMATLRVLRVQRARQQGEKSTLEIEGIVFAFESIRDQLVNNRIDSKERRDRIELSVVEPLKDIVDLQFPDWDETLKELADSLDADQMSEELIDKSIRQTDEILLAMERVLMKMEELESYNELVDLVRSILKQQEDLLEKTKEERKKQAKSLLE